jgi:hypothetical protein
MTSLPYRRASLQSSRKASSDPREDLLVHIDHYIGIDVGTGSARACIIDAKGDIVGLASENIGLWQPEHGYYVSDLLLLQPISSNLYPTNNSFLTSILLMDLLGTIYI